MKFVVNELTGKSSELMKTEILFFVSSAKALGYNLIRLNIKPYYKEERELHRMNALQRILSSVKRQGVIELFIKTCELSDTSTESEYLKNKFPDIDKQNDGDLSYILKI